MLIGFIIIKLFKYLSPRTNRFRRLRVGPLSRAHGRPTITAWPARQHKHMVFKEDHTWRLHNPRPASAIHCANLWNVLASLPGLSIALSRDRCGGGEVLLREVSRRCNSVAVARPSFGGRITMEELLQWATFIWFMLQFFFSFFSIPDCPMPVRRLPIHALHDTLRSFSQLSPKTPHPMHQ